MISSQLDTTTEVKLSSLKRGAIARIAGLGQESRSNVSACKQALQAIGMRVGDAVEVCRHGGPLIVKVKGARVGISPLVAEQILVTPQA